MYSAIVFIIAVSAVTFVDGAELNSQGCPKDSNDGSFMLNENWTWDYYAPLEGGESMYCQVKNFSRVEWYKDDVDLTKDERFDTDSTGQILNIKDVKESDEGNYTCVVFSDKGNYCATRTLFLRTYSDIPILKPKLLPDEQCVDQTATKGDSVTFECKFFFPQSMEPSFTWFTLGPNSENCTEFPEEEDFIYNNMRMTNTTYRVAQRTDEVNRSERYATLQILNVTDAAYGIYQIRAYYESDPIKKCLHLLPIPAPLIYEPPTHYNFVAPAVLLVSCTLFMALIWKFAGLDIKLYVKDNWRSVDQYKDKTFHAYISCASTPRDIAMALNLKSSLESKGYKIWLPETDSTPGSTTLEEISEALQKSCRVIILVSPDCLTSQNQPYEVDKSVAEISKYREYVIPVIISDVTNYDCDSILKLILKKCKTLKWSCDQHSTNNHDDETLISMDVNSYEENVGIAGKFFKELLLALPPKPKLSSAIGNARVVSNNKQIGTELCD